MNYIISKGRGGFHKKLGKETIIQSQIIQYVNNTYNIQAIPCNAELPLNPNNPNAAVRNLGQWLLYWIKVMGFAKGALDIFIPYANHGYHGLFIELKVSRETIYTKKGKLRKSEHLEMQKNKIEEHRKNGYKAEFGCGFDETKDMIDEYFAT